MEIQDEWSRRVIASCYTNTLYIGSNDHYLYALSVADGTERWKYKTGSRVASSPAVYAGRVYFGSYDGNIYALDAQTGKLRWKFSSKGEQRFTAKHLHGSEPAAESMPDPFDFFLSSPTVTQKTVYVGSDDGNVYALDSESGAAVPRNQSPRRPKAVRRQCQLSA